MLIAVPNVLSFVKESKRGAHLNKAEFLERSAIDNYNIEIANNINPKALTYTFVDGVESSVNTTLKLVKRKKGFLDGILKVNIEGKVAYAFYEDDMCIEKGYDDVSGIISEKNNIACLNTVP